MHRDRRGGRHPDLGKYWGDSLGGAVGPLVGYFLCRGVEGGGGPTIISILASKQKEDTSKCTVKPHAGAAGGRQRREERPSLKQQGDTSYTRVLLPTTPWTPHSPPEFKRAGAAGGRSLRGRDRCGPPQRREWPPSAPWV